jgi:hypothetical protein
MERAPRYLEGCTNIIDTHRLVVEQLVGEHDSWAVGIYRWPAALAPTSASGGETGFRPSLNEPTFKLRQGGEDKKDELT